MKPMELGDANSSASATFECAMKKTNKPRSSFAVCVNNRKYPASLELHKIYRVLPDPRAAKDGFIRVVDESGEDYLFPAGYFVPIEVPAQVKRSLQRAS